jgi:hypothetical protein
VTDLLGSFGAHSDSDLENEDGSSEEAVGGGFGACVNTLDKDMEAVRTCVPGEA